VPCWPPLKPSPLSTRFPTCDVVGIGSWWLKQEQEGSNISWILEIRCNLELKLDTFSNCTLKKDRKDSQKKPFNFSDEPFSEVLETTAGCPSPSLEIVSGQLHQENFELSMFFLVGGFNHLEKYES
jgi:hypothetical protein